MKKNTIQDNSDFIENVETNKHAKHKRKVKRVLHHNISLDELDEIEDELDDVDMFEPIKKKR